jgi:hypothetical protein
MDVVVKREQDIAGMANGRHQDDVVLARPLQQRGFGGVVLMHDPALAKRARSIRIEGEAKLHCWQIVDRRE